MPFFSSVYILTCIGQIVPKAFGMTINPEISGHFAVCLMIILIVSISCVYNLTLSGHIACPELVSGESHNYNHPSVCRLRLACLLQAGSISYSNGFRKSICSAN